MRGKENPTHVIALLNLADAYATIVVCSKHVQFQSQLFLISITVVDDAEHGGDNTMFCQLY